MPTYEYRCPHGHEFEKFYRKISDATSELACPECGEIASRQVSGGAGLLFKGSGFYLTDYGKNAHRKTAPESGGDKSGGGNDKKEKKESKPADSGSSTAGGGTESKPSAKKPGSGSGKSDG